MGNTLSTSCLGTQMVLLYDTIRNEFFDQNNHPYKLCIGDFRDFHKREGNVDENEEGQRRIEFVLNGWEIKQSPNLPDVFEKTVVFLGAFKTGKSYLIKELIGCDTDSHATCNTRGMQFYTNGPDDRKILYVDTEGLFQFAGDSRDKVLQSFILNYIALQASCVVYVLERTFQHDKQMLEDLWSLFRKPRDGSRHSTTTLMSQLIVVHNYQTVTTIKDLNNVIEKNPDYLSHDAVTTYGHVHMFSEENSGDRNAIHYLMGNDRALPDLKRMVISSLRRRIMDISVARSSYVNAAINNVNICRATKATMFHHYEFNRDNCTVFSTINQNMRISFVYDDMDELTLPIRSRYSQENQKSFVGEPVTILQRGVFIEDTPYLQILVKCSCLVLPNDNGDFFDLHDIEYSDENNSSSSVLNTLEPSLNILTTDLGNISFVYGNGFYIMDREKNSNELFRHFEEIRFRYRVNATHPAIWKYLEGGALVFMLQLAENLPHTAPKFSK